MVASVSLTLALAGCSAEGPGNVGSTGEGASEALGHVHGIGTDPADGTVYVASHFGVLRVEENGDVTRVADRWQDTMAFTVVGPGHFLASGHPDQRENLPVHLGLIESTDAARTWEPISLQGEADFHALEVIGERIYGYDSVGGRLLVTDDRREWRLIARESLIDIAVDPDDHDRLLATTGEGGLVEYQVDTGAAPTTLEAPVLAFVDWADADTLVGLAPDGTVLLSADGGRGWQRAGEVPGDAQALEVSEDHWYTATSSGVYLSTDFGRRWEPLLPQDAH